MKQIIPFTKDITFKTDIDEIISISLDHDLKITDDSIIKGNFYVKGSYKIHRSNIDNENFSYKIPCEIDIAGNYNLEEAIVEIDDFNYKNEKDVLQIDIKLLLDNLKIIEEPKLEEIKEEKELVRSEETKEDPQRDNDKVEQIKEEINEQIKDATQDNLDGIDININNVDALNIFNLNDQDETYLTYYVYIYQEDDTIESILDKYKVTKYDLMEYNDLDDIKIGSKLIIPSNNA